LVRLSMAANNEPNTDGRTNCAGNNSTDVGASLWGYARILAPRWYRVKARFTHLLGADPPGQEPRTTELMDWWTDGTRGLTGLVDALD
jgi:hypothetical protein